MKERLLTETWKEPVSVMSETHRDISLILSSEVALLLERRRILREDIQKVLYDVSQTGRACYRQDTGHFLASFKPYHVTFWVEYAQEKTDQGITPCKQPLLITGSEKRSAFSPMVP